MSNFTAMIISAISRNSLALALFATITTAVIAATYLGTRDTIAINIRNAEVRSLNEIIDKARYDNDLLNDTVAVNDSELLGLRTAKPAYIARKHGSAIAVILPATARDGYSGDIDMIIGINADGTLAGVRDTNQKETPGLGDLIARKKSNWIEQFVGKSLSNPGDAQWKVKKDGGDFDQLTGATITPRAVVAAIYRSQQYFVAHRAELLGAKTATADSQR